MNTGPSEHAIGAILDASAMALQFIREAVRDVAESRMTEQFGSVVNHPAWTLAHLGAYSGLLLGMLDDPSAPTADAEMQQFGYGTTPVADRAVYPSKSELLARLADRHARLASVVAEKHGEYFARPTPEKYRAFTSTIGHIAVILLVSHPSYHLGQLNQWRRAAGFAARS